MRRNRRFELHTDAVIAAAADPDPHALDRLIEAGDRAALAAAIAALPAASREVVVLYYREGQSAAQVAALLDLSEDAVKQRLSRARQRLRNALTTRLEHSAPDAAFTVAVLGALASVAAPAAASAAVVGAGKAGHAGAVASGMFGAALFSAFAGLAGGWAGVFFGTRQLLRLARDEEERRGVLLVGVACMLVTLAFMLGILFRPTPVVATIGFLTMMACFSVTHFLWLPHITRRRVAAEILEDPAGAAVMHRKRHVHARVGFALGTLLGGATVIASWFF